jgi:hypothetical protein
MTTLSAQLSTAERLPSNHPKRAALVALAEDLREAAAWAAKVRCRRCGGPAEVTCGRVRVAHAMLCSAARSRWRTVRRTR